MAQDIDINPIVLPPDGGSRRRLIRLRLIVLFLLLLAVIVLLLCFIGVFVGNFQVVWPGQVYRSAQLTGNNYTADTAGWIGHDLPHVLKAYHIKTVINLRGGSSINDYYRDELRICARMGVNHVDVPLSASHLPPPDSLDKLLATFDHTPYPVIFHCQGGADRAGLVGTLYLNIYKHIPLDQAEQAELTWRFGHLAFTATGAMDRFFTLYRQTGQGMDLRTWILTKYPVIYGREKGKGEREK